MKKNHKLNSNLAIRLNKFIANSGVCSRREADIFIKAGVVTVNGKGVTKMGAKINENDIVKFNGETITTKKQIYILQERLHLVSDFLIRKLSRLVVATSIECH